MSKWKPGLNLTVYLQRIAIIWVLHAGLTLEFWDDNFFHWVNDSFDHFIMVDVVTQIKSKLGFSRLYMNVVVHTTIPNYIILNAKWGLWRQAISFENADL